ncbi:zf-HC2 domain-containing protein [Actinokineospora guangxiensis]|uniref:Zf-HC2 domain-containing protein n=1 Tax=Actinokineospora guangxiensis TaxID=1490288 RepID=A0ABW0EQ88_9PSEU
MVCDTCREALSARIDGEAGPVPPAEVDAHLADCPACTAWLAKAEVVSRRMRVREAVPAPDLTAAVLAALPPQRTAPRARIALGVVAVLQMGVVIAQVLGAGAHADHTSPGHLFNEGIAWNAALAIGLLMAAIRTDQARGLLTTLTAFVGVLGAYSVYDLFTAAASPYRVLSHLPVVAGLLLLHAISRAHRAPPSPADRQSTDDHHSAHPTTDSEGATPRTPGTGPLRPTARHAA